MNAVTRNNARMSERPCIIRATDVVMGEPDAPCKL
jgi:hypothetical protein